MNPIIATTSAAVCRLNGQVVPCEQLTDGMFKWLIGAGLGLGALFFLFVVLVFVFWLRMLIHAVKHPSEHQLAWVVVLCLTGLLGAIIYYFAVKREMPNTPPATPTTPVV